MFKQLTKIEDNLDSIHDRLVEISSAFDVLNISLESLSSSLEKMVVLMERPKDIEILLNKSKVKETKSLKEILASIEANELIKSMEKPKAKVKAKDV